MATCRKCGVTHERGYGYEECTRCKSDARNDAMLTEANKTIDALRAQLAEAQERAERAEAGLEKVNAQSSDIWNENVDLLKRIAQLEAALRELVRLAEKNVYPREGSLDWNIVKSSRAALAAQPAAKSNRDGVEVPTISLTPEQIKAATERCADTPDDDTDLHTVYMYAVAETRDKEVKTLREIVGKAEVACNATVVQWDEVTQPGAACEGCDDPEHVVLARGAVRAIREYREKGE